MSIDHVYCINLERRPDRRESAQEQFTKIGIENVEFFNATDGKLFAPDGIHITQPEWGCAYSHIRLWKDMLEKGYETVLVFEDDVKISDGFLDKLALVFDDMKDIDWDYINLGPSPEPFRISDVWESEFVKRGLTLMTHCYIITRKGAMKIAFWDPDDLYFSIDHQLIQVPLKMYYTKETLAAQEFEDYPWVGFMKSVVQGDIGISRTLPYDFIFKSSKIHWIFVLVILLIYVYYVSHKWR